ncbi:MAG: NADH-quinone oxidoreductase subunit J [Candidatus Zixiibacteriota bacterium]|nr:MAG: NADH-quinone oxidoreductase subunit J [candidate division Zixibacteria bacterium]
MNLDTLIFIISAVVAVFGGTMMIAQRNPVLSVMYLILSLVAQAVLYVQLGALFLGAILIIVYSGAILVLFLFVIMLLNLRGTEDLGHGSQPISRFTKFVLSILFVFELIAVVKTGFIRSESPIGMMTTVAEDFGSVKAVATLLFTKYVYPFELAGILLLAAIVGAVVMTRDSQRGDSLRIGSAPDSQAPDIEQETGGEQ